MGKAIDIPDVVERNEKKIFGKKVLFVALDESAQTERLLIVMSAHNQGGKYMALRSFLENQNCDLLFVSDPANSWYLDGDGGETFLKVFQLYAQGYEPQNVFLFGSSMSGYGAIYHAFKMNANAIASNPQINLDITKDYAWPELVKHIDEIGGDHVNLDEVARLEWKDSAVYIIHGHDEIDTVNVELLARVAPPNKKLIIQTLDVDSHVMFFGKDVSYVYSVMGILSAFRVELNLEKVLAQLVPEDKTNRRLLRAERKLSTVHDPYRTLHYSENSIAWQNRYLHQQVGKQVSFANIGLYAGRQLTGGSCFYDGVRWRLLSPIPSINDNLIALNSFRTKSVVRAAVNNQFINEHWWARNDAASDITVLGEADFLEVQLHAVNSKNIYLSTSLQAAKQHCDNIAGKYMTLSADVFTDRGEVYLTLGGVGESGYHHANSSKSTPGVWRRIHVCQQFVSINSDHRDSVFVRLNLAGDGLLKTVQVKNLSLQVGYYPMGLG